MKSADRMKITHSKYFYYTIIIISLATIAFSIYYQLGGLKKLEVNAYPQVNYSLAGVEFQGRFDDPEIKRIYNEAKDFIQNGQIKGTLSVIDYLDEALGEKEVHFFVGIILDEKVTELPTNYQVKKVEARGVLGILMDIHPLVRPTKNEIEGMIYAAAQENNLTIQNFFLEKHYEDDRVMVEGFVQ